MIIRCKSCHGTVWVQPNREDPRATTLNCRSCKQRYHLDAYGLRRLLNTRFTGRARRYAKENGVDLPGAYSVLLGIMTLEELRAYGQHGSTAVAADAPDASEQPDDRPRKYRFDPAFQAAVEAGFLTPRQAVERGRRESHATNLAKRHGIPLKLAYAIADNRMSIVEALQKRDSAREEPLRVAVPTGPPLRKLGLFATLILAVILAVTLRGADSTSERSVVEGTRTVGSAELHTDASGRVVQVLGPDPKTVLKTYCEAGGTVRCEPLDVVPSTKTGIRARLGLFRNPQDRSSLLAITIEEDRESARWVAGDGRGPLVGKPAPPGAERVLRGR